MNQQLVNINKCPSGSFRVISLIDKFFLLGIISGFVGSLYLGIHMWLMLHGKMEISNHYILFKELHSIIQLYLFLGSFIIGFLLHAAPKFTGADIFPNPKSIFLIPLLISGLIFQIFLPVLYLGRICISLSYIYILYYVSTLLLPKIKESLLVLFQESSFLLGILILAISIFTELSNPINAYFVIWYGIMPILFRSSQLFIQGALKGNRLGMKDSCIFSAIYLISILFFIILRISYKITNAELILFGILNLVQIIFFIIQSKSYPTAVLTKDPMRLAFTFGYISLIFSSILLISGANYLDYVIHLIVLGFALPLTIVVSCRIISALSGEIIISSNILLSLLSFWYFAVLLRVVPQLSYSYGSWIVSIFTTYVISYWSFILIKSIFRMNYKKVI